MSKQNNKKGKNKKYNKDMIEDLHFYEEEIKNDRQYYSNFSYLSEKERIIFENKFSKPRNKSQEYYYNILNKKNKKIIVSTGPAGTGKTLFAIESAIKQFLLGKIDKIILTRPSVNVDEDLGFLPGTLEEKMAPWMRPLFDILYLFISPKETQQLIEDKFIEIAPLGFMRGRTFKNSWIIADEMQNSTPSQMKMLLTRLGENSRIIITGDLDQTDRKDNVNGLDDFLDKFKNRRSDSITSVEFDACDIEREPVVKEVLEIYSTSNIPSPYSELNDNELNDNELNDNELNDNINYITK